MKLYKILVIASIAALMVFGGCKLETPGVTSSADIELSTETTDLFASYVSLGNSLTAGYQSGALTEKYQKNSYAKQIATQAGLGATFAQPLLGYPGLGTYTALGAGVMELQGFDASGNPVIAPVPYVTAGFDPMNPYFSSEIMTHPAPYSNLGIPGIVLADLDSAISAVNSYSHSGLIDPILRNANPAFGNSNPIKQALMLQPTFVSVWIGNNDVLGYATSGGTSPAAPTDPTIFELLYTNMLNKVTSGGTGAKAIVANIPDVTSIPFFTTVPYAVDPGTGTAVALVIQATDGVRQATAEDLILLTGKSLIGDVSGTYGPAGVPVGFDASAPMPTSVVLDKDEIVIAKAAVAAFNTSIANVAAMFGVPVVDMNAFMNDLAKGISVSGVDVDASFLTGGVFSLDGVHPNNLGYAIIANKFIEVINANFDTNLAPVNISDFVKTMNNTGLAKKDPAQAENFLAIPEIFGGKVNL